MRPGAHTHRAILDKLGSNPAVGGALGLHDSTVCRWKSRGIPPAYWPALTRLAKLRRIPLTIEDLEAASPSRAIRRRCAA
jgi:hypothetical protein